MQLNLNGLASNLVQDKWLAVDLLPDRVALEPHVPLMDVGMGLSPFLRQDLLFRVS